MKRFWTICLKATCLTCLSLSFLPSCSASHALKKTEETDQLLKRAKQHQERAEKTTQRELQLQEVGAALELYLKLERRLKDEGKSPSPKLYEAIANAYTLLQQPGWALFYTHQALAITPRDAKLHEKIKELEHVAGLPPSPATGFVLEYQELLNAAAALFMAAFLCGSCAIWLRHRIFKQGALLCTLIGLGSLLSALYVAHATAVYGIVIESTPLYRLPASRLLNGGESHHARIVLEGTQVEVESALPDPAWLMIRLNKDPADNSAKEGTSATFYIPSHAIRLIERKL